LSSVAVKTSKTYITYWLQFNKLIYLIF
jgi:hypothetical protein